jgi:8-oxo-dGTP pyrophosphatase MutT (NUDIX family)
VLDTALRELEEECGIRLERAQLETPLAPAVARRRSGPFLLVAPFVFRVDDEPPAKLDPREAVEALWAPLAELRDPARHALRPVSGVPPETRFPAISLNGLPLWGFTYRLIADWLELNPQDHLGALGLQVAQTLLAEVLAKGCALDHGFVEREGVSVAAVRGTIPVESVWEQAAEWALGPAPHIPMVHMLEVKPEIVRMVGLAFEEYVIRARPLD